MILARADVVDDVTCDKLSRMGMLAGALLHWFYAVVMLREHLGPAVRFNSAPAEGPLLALLAWLVGLA